MRKQSQQQKNSSILHNQCTIRIQWHVSSSLFEIAGILVICTSGTDYKSHHSHCIFLISGYSKAKVQFLVCIEWRISWYLAILNFVRLNTKWRKKRENTLYFAWFLTKRRIIFSWNSLSIYIEEDCNALAHSSRGFECPTLGVVLFPYLLPDNMVASLRFSS